MIIMKKCNVCGKDFDEYDLQEDFGIHTYVGYGSKYDCTHIECDICCDCFDKLYDQLKAMCVIPPVESTMTFSCETKLGDIDSSDVDDLFN